MKKKVLLFVFAITIGFTSLAQQNNNLNISDREKKSVKLPKIILETTKSVDDTKSKIEPKAATSSYERDSNITTTDSVGIEKLNQPNGSPLSTDKKSTISWSLPIADDGHAPNSTPSNYISSTSPKLLMDLDPNGQIRTVSFERNVWDILYGFEMEGPSGIVSLAGAETDGEYIYASVWNSGDFVKFLPDGTFIETFTIPGAVGTRDMAFDGIYIYGAAAAITVWQMDFTAQTMEGSISAPTACRALAYDEETDTFWGNDWDSPFTNFDRDGTSLGSITVPSIYGAAFDNYNDDGPFIWVFSGTVSGGGCQVEQMNLTGAMTGEGHDVSGDFGSAGIAGGLYMDGNIIPGKMILGGTMQGEGNIAFGYEMGLYSDCSVLLEEGFDNDWLPDGWTSIQTHSTNTWTQTNISDDNLNFDNIDSTSLYSAMVPWIAENQDEWLISPEIDGMGAVQLSIEFWAGVSGPWLANATLICNISTDGGINWTPIWNASNEIDPDATWAWNNVTLDLNNYTGTMFHVAWQYVGNDGDIAGIDGVLIEACSTIQEPDINVTPTLITINEPTSSTSISNDEAISLDEKLNSEYKEDEFLIRFNEEVESSIIFGIIENNGCQIARSFSIVSNLFLAKINDKVDVRTKAAHFETYSEIIYAEPNYIVHAVQTFPDDQGFNGLYGMHNTGQDGGTVDADIDAPEAWDIETGDSTVVVGIIDSGMDYDHPDLLSNMWTNPGEIADNGIDDDNNGYIDDIHGWDWAYDDNDPSDYDGHGTHVAGTVGAVGNNSIGVTGVCWTVKLMALKFLDDYGSGSTSDAISAIEYATNNGATLTNNSWGGGGFSASLKTAITNSNMIFAAAAGNGGADGIGDDNDITPHYPSNYDCPNIISVAALDRNNNKAGFSNYGATSVDLGAYGASILSTKPDNATDITFGAPGQGLSSTYYGIISGTSMATPQVAGLAALIHSNNPSLSSSEVKSAILENVEPVSALSGITVTGGCINAYNTLNDSTVSPNSTTIQNVGTADLSITSITDDQPWLSSTGYPTTPFSVSPGNSQGLNVNIDWGLVGDTTETGIITILSNDPDEPSVTVTVIAVVSQNYIPPPTNLLTQVTGSDVQLIWDAPVLPVPLEDWLLYHDGTIEYVWGSDSGDWESEIAMYFEAGQLADYPGCAVTNMKLFVDSRGANGGYVIAKVWEGPDAETLLYEEDVTSQILWNDTINEVTLSQPVPFDNTKYLWLGFTTGGPTDVYIAGITEELPAAERRGDLYRDGGTTSWSHLSDLGIGERVWILEAFVTQDYAPASAPMPLVANRGPAGPAGIILASTGATVTSNADDRSGKSSGGSIPATPPRGFLNSTNNNDPGFGNICMPFSSSSNLLGYNIYRDYALLTFSSNTSYLDQAVPDGTYDYYVTAVYSQGESVPSDTATVTVPYVTQTIELITGWNIHSFMVNPDSLNMMQIHDALIDSGYLIKIIDESGGFMQYIPGFGWLNTIGEAGATEGYYIKVNADVDFDIIGYQTPTPLTIPLISGWNIMGYPLSEPQDAMDAFQDLIDNDELIKVIDESGGFIQYIPGYGWLNTIDNLETDEGYYIKVNTNTDLTLDYPLAQTSYKKGQPLTGIYFEKPLENNPYYPMHIIVTDIDVEGIPVQEGDEIAVFDGELCVGAGVVVTFSGELMAHIIASMDDPTTEEVDGFTEGNLIQFKYKAGASAKAGDLSYTSVMGENVFDPLGTWVVELSGNPDDLGDLQNDKIKVNCYPNPFTDELFIDYYTAGGLVQISLLNMQGIRVAELFSGQQLPGKYNLRFAQGGLPNGVYLLKIQLNSGRKYFSTEEKVLKLYR